MTTDRLSAATVLIIVLLIANLGLTAYTAFRPTPAAVAATGKEATTAADAATAAVGKGDASQLAEIIVRLYNKKDLSMLYEQFDPLARVQFTKEQLSAQMEKFNTLIGRIESYAYSHATLAGNQDGRTYYTLHFKVSLSGGSFSVGNMTFTVVRNAEGLGLFGFFINGTSGPQSR